MLFVEYLVAKTYLFRKKIFSSKVNLFRIIKIWIFLKNTDYHKAFNKWIYEHLFLPFSKPYVNAKKMLKSALLKQMITEFSAYFIN